MIIHILTVYISDVAPTTTLVSVDWTTKRIYKGRTWLSKTPSCELLSPRQKGNSVFVPNDLPRLRIVHEEVKQEHCMTITAETFFFMTKHCHSRLLTKEICLLHNLHSKLGRMIALKGRKRMPERKLQQSQKGDIWLSSNETSCGMQNIPWLRNKT